jgi:ElaB/YqjD/DUF883 family membrane-anchored ribosome-binding protein
MITSEMKHSPKYKAIAIAVAVGTLIGFLAARRRSSNGD